MNQSKIITYRQLKIEILEYSNEVVRYKVIGAPPLPAGVTWDNTPAF